MERLALARGVALKKDNHYQALVAQQGQASRAERKQAFEAEFGDWLAAQNAHFESHGIPGADLRPW